MGYLFILVAVFVQFFLNSGASYTIPLSSSIGTGASAPEEDSLRVRWWEEQLIELCFATSSQVANVDVGRCLQQFNRLNEAAQLSEMLLSKFPGKIIIVTGPPHVGKSSLVEHVECKNTGSQQIWIKLDLRYFTFATQEDFYEGFTDAFSNHWMWNTFTSTDQVSINLPLDVSLQVAKSKLKGFQNLNAVMTACFKAATSTNPARLPVFWIDEAHSLFVQGRNLDGVGPVIPEIFDMLLGFAKSGLAHVVLSADSILLEDLELHFQEYSTIVSIGDLSREMSELYWDEYIPYVLKKPASDLQISDVFDELGGRMIHLLEAFQKLDSPGDFNSLPLMRVARLKIEEILHPAHKSWTSDDGAFILHELLMTDGCVSWTDMRFVMDTSESIYEMVARDLLSFVHPGLFSNLPKTCVTDGGSLITFASPACHHVALEEILKFYKRIDKYGLQSRFSETVLKLSTDFEIIDAKLKKQKLEKSQKVPEVMEEELEDSEGYLLDDNEYSDLEEEEIDWYLDDDVDDDDDDDGDEVMGMRMTRMEMTKMWMETMMGMVSKVVDW